MEHVIEIEELAKQLETVIKNDPTSTGYYGLTDAQVEAK